MPGVREFGYGACSRPGLTSSAPLERYVVLAFYLQVRGGGLRIDGTATLANTNVYDNQATVRVGRISKHARLQRPAGTFRVLAFCMQLAGAGLYIHNGGVANLDGCQVYENVAEYVRACLSPLPGFPSTPR